MRGHENGSINGNFVFEDGDILRFLVNYRNRWKFFDHRIINQFIVFSYFFLFFFYEQSNLGTRKDIAKIFRVLPRKERYKKGEPRGLACSADLIAKQVALYARKRKKLVLSPQELRNFVTKKEKKYIKRSRLQFYRNVRFSAKF